MYFLRNVKLFENYAVLGGELTHFYTDPYLHILLRIYRNCIVFPNHVTAKQTNIFCAFADKQGSWQ
jgi:hypothetical protein